MAAITNYQYLLPRSGSRYRQLFLKGTNTRAETIYREVVGPEPRTAEEVAADRGVSLDAVLECIDYCENNEDLLRLERDEDLASMKAMGLFNPPLNPNGDLTE